MVTCRVKKQLFPSFDEHARSTRNSDLQKFNCDSDKLKLKHDVQTCAEEHGQILHANQVTTSVGAHTKFFETLNARTNMNGNCRENDSYKFQDARSVQFSESDGKYDDQLSSNPSEPGERRLPAEGQRGACNKSRFYDPSIFKTIQERYKKFAEKIKQQWVRLTQGYPCKTSAAGAAG